MKKTVFLLLLCLSLCSCSLREKKETVSFFAMDTIMTLTAYGDNAETALKKCEAELYRLDMLLSATNPESEVHRLNKREIATVSNDTATLISKALELSEITNGAFDISIYPLVKLWGFPDKNYRIPSKSEISKALTFCNHKQIIVSGNDIFLPEGFEIDLGGIAKGFAADKISEILKAEGIEHAIISLGGNVVGLNGKPDGSAWNIQIKDTQKVLEVKSKSVVTAGDYQRFFIKDGKTYHHIIDPKTGCPADTNLKSVTVIAESSAEADALSTAFFVMGEKKAIEFLKNHPQYDAVFIPHNN